MNSLRLCILRKARIHFFLAAALVDSSVSWHGSTHRCHGRISLPSSPPPSPLALNYPRIILNVRGGGSDSSLNERVDASNCHVANADDPPPTKDTPSPVWRISPPCLALITEPDACSSPLRVNETVRAVERAAKNGGVDLVVIRVAFGDDDDDDEEDVYKAICFAHRKMELIRRLAALKANADHEGASFRLVINDDVEAAERAIRHGIAVDGVHVKERNNALIPKVRRRLALAKQQYQDRRIDTDSNESDLTESGSSSSNRIGVIIGTSCHSLESACRACGIPSADKRTSDSTDTPRSDPPDYLFVGTCYPTMSHPEKSSPESLEGPALPGRIRSELHRFFSSTPVLASEGADGKGDGEKEEEEEEEGVLLGENERLQPSRSRHSRVPIVFAIGGIDADNCAEPVASYGADGVATIRSVMTADEPEEEVKRMKIAMMSNV